MNDSSIVCRILAEGLIESLRRKDIKTAYKVMMAIYDFVFDEAKPIEFDETERAMATLILSQLEESKNGGENHE